MIDTFEVQGGHSVMIGLRLKEIREDKKLSQGDIERISGLKRCYVSRVENGHTVPAVETLEKLARALDVPMYRLFYEGEELPAPPQRRLGEQKVWATPASLVVISHDLRWPCKR